MKKISEIVEKVVKDGGECLSLISLELEEVPADIFSGKLLKGNITSLKLDFNDLRFLPKELGMLLTLKELFVTGNQLSTLTEAISELVNLEELHLNENNIEELPRTFGKLAKLRVLNLIGNGLTMWHEDFGPGLSSLTELRLDENDLSSLPGTFTLMKNLRILELGDNHLEALPTRIGDLSNLEILNLSQNEIEELPESFGLLSRLISLDITGNHITTLPDEFESADEIQHFYADNNSLKVLPAWFEKLQSIVNLCLSDNELVELALPPQFGSISGKTLETLDLSANKMTALPDSIGELKQLRSFHLGSTIREIERRAFQNGNWLTYLPDSFSSMTNLTKLHLDENQLVALPENFGDLINLQWLDLAQNRIECLPGSFCFLSKLWYLQVSKNHLSELPENFGDLTNLVELRLDSNNLTALPDSFAKLQKVQTVDLFCNQLSEIPKVLLKLENLLRLDLDRNNLKIKADRVPKLTTQVTYAPRDPRQKNNWRGKLREDKVPGILIKETIAALLENTPDDDIQEEEEPENRDEEVLFNEGALERAMRRGLSIWRSHTGPDEREINGDYSQQLRPTPFLPTNVSPMPSNEIFEDAIEENLVTGIHLQFDSLSVVETGTCCDQIIDGNLTTSTRHSLDSEDWDLEVEEISQHQLCTSCVPVGIQDNKPVELPIMNQLQNLISLYPPALQAFTRCAKYDSVYPCVLQPSPAGMMDLNDFAGDGQFDDAED